ncbi:MAG: hypothetical protein RLP02_24725 [Coleofasciculus sp. C2-GNP5-27]
MKSEKLQQWALTAEIVGGLAVIATLLILILEVRDNTGAIRLQALDGARDRFQEQAIFIAQNSRVWAKSLYDPGSLTREELITVSYITALQRNNIVASYEALKNGIISEEEFDDSLHRAQLYFGHPLGKVLWKAEREYLIASDRENLALQIDNVLDTSTVMNDLEWTQYLETTIESEFE